MAVQDIVLYPRGFLGFDIGLAARDPSNNLDQILQAIKFNKPVPKQDVIVSNHDVDALWQEYVTGAKHVVASGFRDKILLAALRAFGTMDFGEWCAIQEMSPYFTDMHRRFLNDTFGFIATGNRAVSILSWQKLVEYQEATHKDRETRLEHESLFCEGTTWIEKPTVDSAVVRQSWPTPWIDGYEESRPRRELVSVLHFWCAKHGGLEDLIASLHILFGSIGSDHR